MLLIFRYLGPFCVQELLFRRKKYGGAQDAHTCTIKMAFWLQGRGSGLAIYRSEVMCRTTMHKEGTPHVRLEARGASRENPSSEDSCKDFYETS